MTIKGFLLKQSITSEFKNTFLFLGQIFLLFILLFEIHRTIFFIYYYDKIGATENIFSEVIGSYWHAISLDISMASYFIVIPWLLILLYSLVRFQLFKTLLFIYVLVIMFLSSISYITELGVYNEWEEKPNFEVFMYLKHPDEILNSNPWIYTIILTLLTIVLMTLFYKLTKRVFRNNMLKTPKNYLVTLVYFLLMPGIVLLGARGGTSSAVISQSDVYFSKQKIYNDAAINTPYNLLNTSLKAKEIMSGKNPYISDIDPEKKAKILAPLVKTDPDCNRTAILSTERPNVVLIILESWAGDFVDKDQRYRDVIPNFMHLAKEGILFTNAYGSGALSHEGIPSVLSGWPDLFNVNVSQISTKSNKLPSITQSLASNGYKETMFLYGGQLRYGNLTSYIYSNDFDIIEEYKDITSITDEKAQGRLGIHDGYMLQYLVEKTNKLQTPFFTSLFTLSSHSPYDQPMEDVIGWAGIDNDFLNSVYYTDRSIGEFIESAKKEPWFENTLFIFTADHSHHTPLGWNRNDPRWHHIPILLYGDVIKEEFRGQENDTIVSQHDIAATLLSQLNIDHRRYTFSKDVFCQNYSPSAYFVADNGYGMITPDGYLSYSIVDKRVHRQDGNNSEALLLQGHLYLEHLLQTFLDY